VKRKGRHPEKALTAVQVRAAKKPGRYADGNGLHLVVDPSGAKRWVLRTMVQGVRRDIGLGGVTLVSLAEARDKAAAMRKIARDGADPLADRRRAAQRMPTFAEAASHVHEARKAGWKNSKHVAQWLTTLKTYAFPIFGERPVDQITTADVLRALSPIWLEKPETARRLRQRIGTVFDWAKAAGHRTGDNPIEGVSKGLPNQGDRDEHFTALPYKDVPQFVTRLREGQANPATKLAFEFLILTASRTSEVLNARWSEIDDFDRLWVVPAERMKMGRVHRVPLSARCVEIIEAAKALPVRSEFIFPSQKPERPLSNMVFLEPDPKRVE